MKHAVHGCDAGRVETERLVERRRALPSQKRACDERRGAGQEAGEQCGGGGASSVQEEGPAGGVGAQGKRRSARETFRMWI